MTSVFLSTGDAISTGCGVIVFNVLTLKVAMFKVFIPTRKSVADFSNVVTKIASSAEYALRRPTWRAMQFGRLSHGNLSVAFFSSIDATLIQGVSYLPWLLRSCIDFVLSLSLSLSLYIYIYIYIYHFGY